MDFFKRTIILLLLSSVNQFGAGQSSTKNLAKSMNNFSLNFYKEIAKNDNGNVFCSGYSLSTALSMLLVGARTKTAVEIQNTLGYQGLAEKQVESAYHDLLTKQRSNSKGYQLDVANSVWIQQGFNVLQSFKDTVEKVYYAEEQQVNFGSSAATDQINKWVSDKTHGKIPKLFDAPLDASTRLVLANAMYFKGTWKTKFDTKDTAKGIFYLGNSDKQKSVDMMNIYNSFPYADNFDFNAQILELPYDGEDVSMIVILPKNVGGLYNLEKHITEANLETCFNNLHSTKVHVKIPKFKASSSYDLISMLQNLGIKTAFGNRADLSGIDGKRDLYVSKAVQKAVVEVNEEGTEAAAATGLRVIPLNNSKDKPREIYFTADHPFVYIIRHNPTKVVLFLGRTASP